MVQQRERRCTRRTPCRIEDDGEATTTGGQEGGAAPGARIREGGRNMKGTSGIQRSLTGVDTPTDIAPGRHHRNVVILDLVHIPNREEKYLQILETDGRVPVLVR